MGFKEKFRRFLWIISKSKSQFSLNKLRPDFTPLLFSKVRFQVDRSSPDVGGTGIGGDPGDDGEDL